MPTCRLCPDSPDPTRQYASPNLFATFANRVATPRRDCYQSFLDMIGLSGEGHRSVRGARRTWGTRVTDRIQVLPVPKVDAGGRLHAFPRARWKIRRPRRRGLGDGERGRSVTRWFANPGIRKTPWRSLCADGSSRAVEYVLAPVAPFVHALGNKGSTRGDGRDGHHARCTAGVQPDAAAARLRRRWGADFDVMAALNPERVPGGAGHGAC